MSDREKAISREVLDKKTNKFMTPNGFVRHFGKMSAIPLRQEGQIRGFSEFAGEISDQSALNLKVGDCITLKKDDKSKQIGGTWKKF